MQQERNDLLNYLKLDKTFIEPNMVVTQTRGFFRREKKGQDGCLLQGTISNTATMANYKDVVISVTYLSETMISVKTESFVIYKYFNTGVAANFGFVIHPPAEMKHFTANITNATAVN